MGNRILVGKMNGETTLGDLGVDRRIILKLIFKNWDTNLNTGLICFRIRTSGGLL
jgi:hypothetical protein